MQISKADMAVLKKDYARSQRYGVHFITASLIIWIIIACVNFADILQYYKNVIGLCSSAVLVPLAILFSKIYKIKFSDKDSPLNSAGLVFALNQIVYLLAVMLVWVIKPEQMFTAYAIVVGAHFLPYSWLYDSLTYRLVAIIVPLVAFILALTDSMIFVPLVVVIADIIMLIIFLKKK